jgi:hypothetical protein
MLKILRTALEPIDAAPTAATKTAALPTLKTMPAAAAPAVTANASKSPAPSASSASTSASSSASSSSSGASAIKRTRTGLCERVTIFFGAFAKLLLLAADPITALRSATCLPSFGSRKARWLEPYIEVCDSRMPLHSEFFRVSM